MLKKKKDQDRHEKLLNQYNDYSIKLLLVDVILVIIVVVLVVFVFLGLGTSRPSTGKNINCGSNNDYR
jgi:hypothetical protein